MSTRAFTKGWIAERRVVSGNRIIAVGLLTQNDLDRLGDTFTRLWPVQEAPCFEELLEAIDKADEGSQERSESLSKSSS
jgi:hypothetical protein